MGVMGDIWDRYASPEMEETFSSKEKYKKWRTLWYLLAENERMLGLSISEEQLEELHKHIADIDFNRAAEIEAETHHDVVAHLRVYAEQCPKAAPILHMGATSCYITDNADFMTMNTAANIIVYKLHKLIESMCDKADKYRDVVTVGRTHFQPAQPTTVGKRIVTWTQDFVMDLQNMTHQLDNMQPLGCKGATGTCDSFLKLFNGDTCKVEELDYMICCKISDNIPFRVSGQTYTRKQDFYILQVLSGIAQSASKMATDIRLLSGIGEVYEPFANTQVGSSAMPYKKNPMLCERICGLSRYVICGLQNVAITASSQWLERSLDDSSNRRILIPEMFIATDAILNICRMVIDGMNIDTDNIQDHLYNNRSKIATEGILMYCVAHGGDRQKLHEKLRRFYTGGSVTSLISIANDPDFNIPKEELKKILESDSCGIASEQVRNYTRWVRMYELPR